MLSVVRLLTTEVDVHLPVDAFSHNHSIVEESGVVFVDEEFFGVGGGHRSKVVHLLDRVSVFFVYFIT